MSWDIRCTQRKFFVEKIFATRIYVSSPVERILFASCHFTGVYLKRNTAVPFLETEKVVLGVNTAQIENVEYSLFLPKDIPPSYSGANIAVVYSLNIQVQGTESTYNTTIMCSVVSGIPVSFESSAKMLISEKYANVRDLPDEKSLIAATNAHERYCYEEIVNNLRKLSINRIEPAEFILKSKKVDELLKEPLSQVCAQAKAFWVVEKENTHHPLDLYSKILKYAPAQSSRQSFYSIRTQGIEYAKLLLSIVEEEPPHCLLHLSMEVLDPIENIRISLVQVETVEETEEKSSFFTTSKNILFAKNVEFAIPLDRARNPTIVTPNFNTQVELKLEIDSKQPVRIKIK
ncbi:hypothetical protein NEMIN01_1053 [Nematocida minor]|uniref:uncharacterized protein n=1 Tax=Nematocida minor TaxID=1912983 RepID=UPI0022204CC9|nr:uncharacterized protein NEMIN01_1053 [Nematocida minor]KAI5190429.1 hypothetical protein NEMIN01_1053 [Nematocida minor]